jgi:hypothetical protein
MSGLARGMDFAYRKIAAAKRSCHVCNASQFFAGVIFTPQEITAAELPHANNPIRSDGRSFDQPLLIRRELAASK